MVVVGDGDFAPKGGWIGALDRNGDNRVQSVGGCGGGVPKSECDINQHAPCKASSMRNSSHSNLHTGSFATHTHNAHWKDHL